MATAFSSSSSANYHVFLSFRGEDTRDKFISHLFKELSERKKLKTFFDEDIKKGESISADLLNSIEGSMVSVVIFSEHYGDSKWCLDELVKILECKERNGQIVIPVFYNVHPSDVKEQKGRFGKAFEDNAKKFKKNSKKVQKWRDVLKETSLLAGHESAKIRSDAKLVDVIAKDILQKLEQIIVPIYTKGLIGIGSRISRVESLLDIGKSDFRIVGIWGRGGTGKTTIAEALFNQNLGEFESKLFMANVREKSEKIGLKNLQKEILSHLLEDNVEAGGLNIPKYIKDKLRNKKVFIVLDDVNELWQLEYLAGGLDRFGSGSRVIITTRDKIILDKFGVDRTYEVEGLNHNESLMHFYNIAFSQKQRLRDLIMLSMKVVDYAKGNPLVLKVLGSFFYEKSKPNWEKALTYLGQTPDADIYSILKFSYDELNRKSQDIFLDIVRFVSGDDEDHLRSFFDDPCLRDKDRCANVGLSDRDHHTCVPFDFLVDSKERPHGGRVNVKYCGVCPIYAHPMETKPNSFTINALPTTEEECRKLHVGAHDEAGTSGNAPGNRSFDESDEKEINAPREQSNWFLSQIFGKTRNLVVAGGLTAFAFGLYSNSKRAVGGTNELQVSNLKSKKSSKSPEESKAL